MSETTLNILNSDHIQANKLNAKCTAAYPIMLLPLRLETRFMHIEPVETTTSDSSFVLADIGQTAIIHTLANIPEKIEKTIQQLDHLHQTLPVEENVIKADALTAWKYIACNEITKIYSKDWISRYQAVVDQLENNNQAILQKVQEVVLQQKEGISLLSATQKDEIAIYANQVLHTFVHADEVSTTQASQFLNIQEQLLEQLQLFVDAVSQYGALHPEDYAIVQNQVTEVQKAINQWLFAASEHVKFYTTKTTKLKTQLQSLQTTLANRSNSITKDSPYAAEAAVWKKLSSSQAYLKENPKLLENEAYNQLVDQMNLITQQTEELPALIMSLETPSALIHSQARLLEVEFSHLDNHTSTVLNQQQKTISHYHTRTTNLYSQLSQAVEQLRTKPESNFSTEELTGKITELGQSFENSFSGISQLLNHQIALNEQLFQLIQILYTSPALREEDKIQLQEQLTPLANQYAVWQNKVNTELDNITATRSNVNKQASTQVQNLQRLNTDYLRNKAYHPEAEVWYQVYDLQLALYRQQHAPLDNLLGEMDQLVKVNQKLEGLTAALDASGERRWRLNLALAENQGRAAAYASQLLAAHTLSIRANTNYSQRLSDLLAYLDAKKSAIKIGEPGSAKVFMDIQAALQFCNESLAKISGAAAPTAYQHLLNYDYQSLNNSLQFVVDLITPITALPTESKDQLTAMLDETATQVQTRLTAINNWSNELSGQQTELEVQQNNLTKAVNTQFETYLGNHSMSSILQLHKTAYTFDYFTGLLDQIEHDALWSETLLDAWGAAAAAFSQQATNNLVLTPRYKKQLNTLLVKAKYARTKLTKPEQLLQKSLQSSAGQLQYYYEEYAVLNERMKAIQEGEALSQSQKDQIQTYSQQLSSILVQNESSVNHAEKRQEQNLAAKSILANLLVELKSLYNQGILAEDLTFVKLEYQIIEGQYASWKQSSVLQQQQLDSQIQALTTQVDALGIHQQNTQTGVAAMAAGGNFGSTQPWDEGIIVCWWPTGDGNGGGPGNPGGDPDPPDPTEISNYELWIRAYPDDIAINAHEKRLTDDEIQDGIIYWTAIWNAAGDEQIELGGWRVLAEKYSPERAAWIARQMTPVNINQRPGPSVLDETVLNDIDLMPAREIINIGSSFWTNVAIQLKDQEALSNLINDFTKAHSEAKATALAHITYPDSLATLTYQEDYSSVSNLKITEKMDQKVLNFVNKATIEELDAIQDDRFPSQKYGIGLEVATRIVEIRDSKDEQQFKELNELLEIDGLGVEKLEDLKNSLFVKIGEFRDISLQLSEKTISSRLDSIKATHTVATLNQVFPQFPTLTTDQRRDNTWFMPAFTEVLPDQLVFLLYNWEGEVAYEVVGNLIPEQLQVGIDPNDDTQFDPTQPNLGIKQDTIKWMTDFEEAVAKGMAVKIPIAIEEGDPTNEENITPGFSKVFALGIKHYDRLDENTIQPAIQINGEQQIASLLDAHHYTDGGLSLLLPGTATNNTSNGTSSYSLFNADIQESCYTEILHQLPVSPTANRPEDGHVLAEALGIDASIFQHIKNNQKKSSHNAELINKALWMSTWGFYLEEMFGHKDGFFQTRNFLPLYQNTLQTSIDLLHYFKIPEDIDVLQDYFAPFVKGRGSIPVFRVGKQPYGVLTTSALRVNDWKWNDLSTHQPFFDNLQKLLIDYLWGYSSSNNNNHKWLKVVEEQIRTVDDVPNSSSTSTITALQEQFMKILRLHPVAASYHGRYALNPYSAIAGNFNNDIFKGHNAEYIGSAPHFISDLGTEFSYFTDFYKDTVNNEDTTSTSNILLSDLRLFDAYNNVTTEALLPLSGATVDAKCSGSEVHALSPINGSQNYIEWLRQTPLTELLDRSKNPNEDFANNGEPSNALLYISLRNALINQYWDAAMRILEKEGLKDFSFKSSSTSWANETNWNLKLTSSFSDELKNFGELKRNSYKIFIKDVIAGLQGAPEYGDEVIIAGGRLPFLEEVYTHDAGINTASNMTMAEYMFPGTGLLPVNAMLDYPAETARLKGMLDALEALSNEPVAELERLFGEHMDLASHRLDAWILGMANKRLHTIRQNNRNGTYLGAYGWLLELKPGEQRIDINDDAITYTIDENGNVPIMTDPENQGYVQAPSLNHAMTAAVLRSGYYAHKGTADDGLLAVNLSSDRIRRALFYMEGIRNGQPLAALLGYRLERYLREQSLAKYQLDFRKAYPLQQLSYQNASQQPLSPANPGTTTNGLLVIEKLREMQQTGASFADVFDFIAAADLSNVESIVQKIEDDLDALADLALAEGTYQVVKGNYARSNAMMHALSNGSTLPEPEVIKTPRSGHSLTQRVGMTLEVVDTTTAGPQWANSFSPKALTEPALNAKIADLLPAASLVKCRVYYLKRANNLTLAEEFVDLSLEDLQIEPIDLLYDFPENILDKSSQLAKRFYHKAWQIALQNGQSTDAFYDFSLDFEFSDTGWDYTVADIAPLVAQLQLLVLNSRYLKAVDLLHPATPTANVELTGVDSVALQEFINRANQLKTNLQNALTTLLNTSSPVAEDIWPLAKFGLPAAAIAPPTAETVDQPVDYSTLLNQLDLTVNNRIQQFDKIISNLAGNSSVEDRIETIQKAVATLLDRNFLMLPQITALNANELLTAYNDRLNILPQGMPLERWQAGVARVRRQLSRVENIAFLQGLFLPADQASLELSPIQLPYRAIDNWVGLEVPANYYANHFDDLNPVSLDKLSLVLDWHAAPAAQQKFTGLLIDEWTEKIPLAEEMAGLAFHYNQPNAKAPQSILLAVHPQNSDETTAWEWHQLVSTLDATLELAKIRAVEPDHLQTKVDLDGSGGAFDAFSQLLPATFAPVSAPESEENWSTDYHKNINLHLHKNS